LRAFTGDLNPGATASVRGNPCLLHIAETPSMEPPAPVDITQCQTWQEAKERAAVRCWTPTGVEIRLCGHGLLCCANYWQGRWASEGVLVMGSVEVRCAKWGGIDWVSFPTLTILECAIPDWAAHLVGAMPEHAAEAGPADGYLVLAVPSERDIATLPAPGDALEAHTRRSLIVTRQVSAKTSVCGETVQFRYFAPQHGVPEDTATGSAMRVVAAYWQSRGAGDELRALQCSADGGWLQSRLKDDRTWIGGRVIDDREAA
jgi:predicted PhzF superfamily epimerase YddE/YHI9